MTDVCIIIAIAVYLIGMIFIGIRFSNQNKNSEDFYLGGRKMGPLVVAMSAEASEEIFFSAKIVVRRIQSSDIP